MTTTSGEFTQYSTIGKMSGRKEAWWPPEEAERLMAYEKYDQLYWNDPSQYALRVLDGEEPLYIPNSRVIVDTMSFFLMKGLKIGVKGSKTGPNATFLESFLTREEFYSRFTNAKKMGIARGDWAFHITANPDKEEGSRITWESIHPGMVWKKEDPENPGDILEMVVFQDIEQLDNPTDTEAKVRVRALTYRKDLPENGSGPAQIWREEGIYELEPDWFGPEAKLVEVTIEGAYLPPEITQYPIYWFKNIDFDEGLYGSSELRGLEFLDWAVSQGATDIQAALALEGLGVYATDGGRPVDEEGNEQDWEVYPGGVMEVPSGSYFRRVDGVGSITPMLDQIKYMEGKMAEATAMTDVARGNVEVAVAQSGVALTIRFMPTLAKLTDRDTAGVTKLKQMFHDLKSWFKAYESVDFGDEEITVEIDTDKLPRNRTEVLNELNNMLDRKIISRKYYREQMKLLGHDIPENEDEQIIKEAQAFQSIVAAAQSKDEDPSAGDNPSTSADGGNTDNVDNSGSRSNNESRPNESAGTEA